MPRKLPWQTGSSTTVARLKRPVAASTSALKRQKITSEASELEGEYVRSSARKERANRDRPVSSSPPPDPPPESFMKEGMDNDDKYRMVEDEFLSIAQRFTVHLHAAEYKRQQRMAKKLNAETISSISRPVTGKMPNQTKRKVEAVARSKAQKLAIEGLVGKNGGSTEPSDDSDDGDGLPYVGTTLHGLMDSPRRKAASLSKISAAATTRAAAGFKKPAAQSRSEPKSILDSPQPRKIARPSHPTDAKDDSATESSVDDDDLDAPILAPELVALERKSIMHQNTKVAAITEDPKLTAQPSKPKSPMAGFKDLIDPFKKEATRNAFQSPPKPRIRLSRLEQARQQRAKEEEEQKAKKKLDIIPTFL